MNQSESSSEETEDTLQESFYIIVQTYVHWAGKNNNNNAMHRCYARYLHLTSKTFVQTSTLSVDSRVYMDIVLNYVTGLLKTLLSVLEGNCFFLQTKCLWGI